jgi:hypothetical protein
VLHLPTPRTTAALVAGGGLGLFSAISLGLFTTPYSPIVSAYPLNGLLHAGKLVALLAFAGGMLALQAHLAGRLGRPGRVAAVALAVGAVLGAGPHSVVEVLLDPRLSPAVAEARPEALWDAQSWISTLSAVAMVLLLLSIPTLAVSALRQRALPRWAPVVSLLAIPVALWSGALMEEGVAFPHPPAWIFLGLAAYGFALAPRRAAAPAEAPVHA